MKVYRIDWDASVLLYFANNINDAKLLVCRDNRPFIIGNNDELIYIWPDGSKSETEIKEIEQNEGEFFRICH